MRWRGKFHPATPKAATRVRSESSSSVVATRWGSSGSRSTIGRSPHSVPPAPFTIPS
ncbi:hypothetical protein [Arachnia propionica]|uniref:hypothetical protein n=1 Tax=Arachnia propionica TaxID=1750 RepID=UPI0021ADC3E8|nr:hypothetical protein [Arachnia propionica]